MLLMLMSHLMVWAQSPEEQSVLLFEQNVWDFGTINEEDGEVRHTFRYRNTSDGFVSIERVYSSCGCTTGEYSRRPLKAGGEGEFTVVFNPEDRGGRVAKSITIVCSEGKGRTTLYIKGRVNARPLSVEDTHPYLLGGGVRSDSSFKPFGRVRVGKVKCMTVALANTTEESVLIGVEWEKQSGVLEINHPGELEPNEKALVTLIYAPATDSPELIVDEFRFVIDGEPSAELFRTSAVKSEN